MATLSALMTMTKSPPSTLGVNVGLCLPRSRLAAATASRPSTTSVASMTYHERVVSPAFGVYVGTACTSHLSGWVPGEPGAGRSVDGGVNFSATNTDPRSRLTPRRNPRRTERQGNRVPANISAGQNACPGGPDGSPPPGPPGTTHSTFMAGRWFPAIHAPSESPAHRPRGYLSRCRGGSDSRSRSSSTRPAAQSSGSPGEAGPPDR